jgi:hypothetical protein
MADTDDHYRVLGVARNASPPEIRRAYRRLARQHHPDRNPSPDGPERFRALAEAFAVLNDPARRARYNHAVQPSSQREPGQMVTPVSPHILPRRGVLELSAHEARLAAVKPLTLTTHDGLTIVLPAGLADGDQISVAVPRGTALLTIRFNFARKT